MEGNKRKGSAMGESGSSSPKKKGASKLRNSIKSPRDKTQAESVMEGECWKMHKRFFHKWKKQYMVLTAEHLQIFDNYKDAVYNKKCELISLKGLIVKNSPTKMKKGNAFDLFTDKQQYVLAVETPAEKSQWMNCIAQTANCKMEGRPRAASQAAVDQELLRLASFMKGDSQQHMETIPIPQKQDGENVFTYEQRKASFVRTVSAYPAAGGFPSTGPLPGLVVVQGGLARADPRSIPQRGAPAGGGEGDDSEDEASYGGGEKTDNNNNSNHNHNTHISASVSDRRVTNSLTMGRTPISGAPLRPSLLHLSMTPQGNPEASVAAFFTPPSASGGVVGGSAIETTPSSPNKSPSSARRHLDPSKKRPPPAPPGKRRNTGDPREIPRPIGLWEPERLRGITDTQLPPKELIVETNPEPLPAMPSSPKLSRVENVRRAPKHFLPAPVPMGRSPKGASPSMPNLTTIKPVPVIQITEEIEAIPVPIAEDVSLVTPAPENTGVEESESVDVVGGVAVQDHHLTNGADSEEILVVEEVSVPVEEEVHKETEEQEILLQEEEVHEGTEEEETLLLEEEEVHQVTEEEEILLPETTEEEVPNLPYDDIVGDSTQISVHEEDEEEKQCPEEPEEEEEVLHYAQDEEEEHESRGEKEEEKEL